MTHRPATSIDDSAPDLLAAVIDALSDGVALFDRDDRLILGNRCYREVCRSLGLVAERGLPFAAVIDAALTHGSVKPADPEAWRRERLDRHQASAATFEQRIGDSWMRVTETSTPAGDRLVTYTDLTDRQAQAEAMRRLGERHALFATAVESMTAGLVITDRNGPDHPIVFTNPAFEQLTGYAPFEVLGRNCRLLQGPDTDPATVAAIRAAVGRGQAITVEILNYRKDGQPIWLELRLSPVRGLDGVIGHYVGIQTDITERRRAEARLRHAHKMEALGQLTGGIAHEFNNLLTVMMGNADALATELADRPELRALVEAAGVAAQRGAALTRHLLAFGRRQFLAPEAIDLGALLAGLERLLARTLGESVDVVTGTDAKAGRPFADPGQLESALLNLAINARDAMPDGGRLTITGVDAVLAAGLAGTPDSVPAGTYTRIQVADSGAGMPAAVLERAFEPFFTTKPPGQGSGLGLSMVYGFVKQSDGHVQIASRPGAGTTVDLYLPRAVVPAERPGPVAHPPRGSEKVMVVEDEELVRRHAALHLRRLGYQVVEAPDGDHALALLDHGTAVDLLFTDVVMPGDINGYALARAALDRNPAIKVLLTSGYSYAALADGEAPPVPVLDKPYSKSELAEAIRRRLDGR